MNTILQTKFFEKWLDTLANVQANARIVRRIERARLGNFGDHKNVSGPIWEMRIDYGNGYRVYYAQKGKTVYLLLCGGDKSSQQVDIQRAREIWREING